MRTGARENRCWRSQNSALSCCRSIVRVKGTCGLQMVMKVPVSVMAYLINMPVRDDLFGFTFIRLITMTDRAALK